MKRYQFSLLCGLLLAALFCGAADSYSDRDLRKLARISANILKENHYRGSELDDKKLSQQLFDEYFKVLDPSRYLFTQEDILKFESQRPKLDQLLERGDFQFPLAVYDIYRTRQQEFRKFAEDRLKRPFDFKSDEMFQTDRTKEPYAKDHKALEALWEKKLKNDVLYYRLFDRAMVEARKKEDKKSAKDKKDAAIERVWAPKSPEARLLQRLRDVNNDIAQKDRVEVLGIYLNTLAQLYGPHSNYLPPSLDEDFEINMRLSLTGIGATLSSDDGYIKVVSLVPGGPAALQGALKVGDRIVAVTQEDGVTTDVIDMPVSKAVKFIRGPVDTKVTLTILPGEKGRSAVPEQVTITRAKVQLVESEAKGEVREIELPGKIRKKIGVINLPSFYSDYEAEMRQEKDYKSCSNDVRRILEDFKKQGVDAVVMDMRRNGGGYLLEAIRLTGLFITVGPVVQVQSSDRRVEVEKDLDPSIAYSGPLVVLTSKLSASSTEIFAAAIRDLHRGILVGDSRTFGKGTVLNVYPLEKWMKNGGSVTFETAMFYRPAGGSVQQLGIEPDIKLPSLTEEMEIGEMFMDNHLPWNSIEPVKHSKFDPQLDSKAEKLREKSTARISTNKDFNLLQRRIDLFRKYRDKKSVSLNEEKRWNEYQEEKAFQDENEKLYEEKSSDSKNERAFDPVLDEAVNIAGDLSSTK